MELKKRNDSKKKMITARVSEAQYDLLRKHNINVSNVIQQALDQAVKQIAKPKKAS
jgi:post-segregation antitoxin (ccd killing protein)